MNIDTVNRGVQKHKKRKRNLTKTGLISGVDQKAVLDLLK